MCPAERPTPFVPGVSSGAQLLFSNYTLLRSPTTALRLVRDSAPFDVPQPGGVLPGI